MTNTLKNAVKKQVDKHELSKNQLDILQSLNEENKFVVDKRRLNWYQIGTIAASVAMLVMVMLFQYGLSPNKGTMLDKIADEVVINYLKQRPLEVTTSSIVEIRTYFRDVSFQPIFSRYLQSLDLNLLGGRYCSIQGVTAAQLRFKKSDSQKRHTLYEVGYDVSTFEYIPDYDSDEEPVSIYSKGVKVTIWVEKGIMFALTED